MTEQTWEKFPKVFTPALKKRVSKEWSVYFPEFGVKEPLYFQKRVGCFLVKIVLVVKRSREDYTPIYSVTNLCDNIDVIEAALYQQYQTERNTPGYVRLCFHDLYYRNVAARMREQAIIPLEGPISLRDMMAAYQRHAETNKHLLLYKSNIDDPAMICAWAGRPDFVEEWFDWVINFIPTCEEHRIPYTSSDLEAWIAKMRLLTRDPERLRQITRDRVVLHKLTKIPYQDFSDAEYKEAS